MVKGHSDRHCVGYSVGLAAWDNAYHGLCYTSRGAMVGTRNSSMGLT